jgi:hypothetical protein
VLEQDQLKSASAQNASVELARGGGVLLLDRRLPEPPSFAPWRRRAVRQLVAQSSPLQSAGAL